MRLPAVLGLVLVACLTLLTARPADACGVWKMADVGKKLEIKWLINSATIAKGPRKVGALYLDLEDAGGARVVAGKKVLFDVKAGALRKRGRVVGSIEAGTVTIGKRVFEIELTDEYTLHDMPAWKLRVTRDGVVIVTSAEATALCAAGVAAMTGEPPSLEAARAEVVRRLAFYLAWRELGAWRHSSSSSSSSPNSTPIRSSIASNGSARTRSVRSATSTST